MNWAGKLRHAAIAPGAIALGIVLVCGPSASAIDSTSEFRE